MSEQCCQQQQQQPASSSSPPEGKDCWLQLLQHPTGECHVPRLQPGKSYQLVLYMHTAQLHAGRAAGAAVGPQDPITLASAFCIVVSLKYIYPHPALSP